jgi:hypothetical protein
MRFPRHLRGEIVESGARPERPFDLCLPEQRTARAVATDPATSVVPAGRLAAMIPAIGEPERPFARVRTLPLTLLCAICRATPPRVEVEFGSPKAAAPTSEVVAGSAEQSNALQWLRTAARRELRNLR